MAKNETKNDAGAEVEVREKAGPPAPVELFAEHAGEGFEETTADDVSMPFLALLQKMSPQVDKDTGAYVEGAEPGIFLDTATGELFESLDFIVCHYQRAMVEWRSRDEGGGFVAQHPVGYEQDFERETKSDGRWSGRWETPNGYLSDTRYFFGLRVLDDGTVRPGVLSFSSTQTKKARNWVTALKSLTLETEDGRKFQAPIFAALWHIASVSESKDEYTWRGYRVEKVRTLENDPELAQLAAEARKFFIASADRFQPVDEGEQVAEEDADLPF